MRVLIAIAIISIFLTQQAQAKNSDTALCKTTYACFNVKSQLNLNRSIQSYDNLAHRNKHPRHKHKKSRKRYVSFPAKRTATGRRVFIFSPRLLSWAAYNAQGKLIRTGRASGGAHYCRDVKRACRTPRGIFRVSSKGSAGCRSTRYPLRKGGAPMPYCMFFRGNYAIHGSPNVPNYNVSHGCIRVLPSAAKWLSHSFMRIGTTVIVRPY